MDERTAGEVFSHVADAFQGPILVVPTCFRHAAVLAEEIHAVAKNDSRLKDLMSNIDTLFAIDDPHQF